MIDTRETSAGRVSAVHTDLHRSAEQIDQTLHEVDNLSSTAIEQEIATMANLLHDLRAIRDNTAAAIDGSRENINLTGAVLAGLDHATNLVLQQR